MIIGMDGKVISNGPDQGEDKYKFTAKQLKEVPFIRDNWDLVVPLLVQNNNKYLSGQLNPVKISRETVTAHSELQSRWVDQYKKGSQARLEGNQRLSDALDLGLDSSQVELSVLVLKFLDL